MKTDQIVGAPPPPAPRERRDWAAPFPFLVIIYAIVYIALRAMGLGGDAFRSIIARLGFLPLNASVVALAWRASRTPGIDPRAATALRYIADAFLCILAGNAVSIYVGMVLHGNPGDSWANVFYFAIYPLLLAGLLSFPRTRRQPHEHRKFLLDAAAVLLGGGIAIWYLIVRPTTLAHHLTPVGSAIALAYPLCDLLLVLGITTFLLRRPSESRSWPVALFIAGLITFTISDLANDLVFLEVGWFGLSWTDLTYLLTYCLLIAGLARFTWPERAESAPAEQPDSAMSVQPFSPLPYVVIALDYGLVVTLSMREWPAPLAILALGAMSVAVLVIGRQIAAVQENVRLVAERAARANEARFRSLVQHSSDVIAIVGEDTIIRFVSPSVSRIFGYEPPELVGTRLADLLHPDDAANAMASFFTAASRPGVTAPTEWRVRHYDGRWLHVETVGTNLLHEPTVRGIVLNTRDISERKALEAQLTHQAFHDPLTGLANRVLFLDRVSHALSLVRRHSQTLAVLFVDLDSFKTINDSLGHTAGDRLLITIAERLLTCVRTADTVARLGGDEFALLIEDATDDNAASAVADRVAAAVRHPIQLEGKDVFVTASIGIATATDEGSASDLLRNADMAMYMAKSRGKARYERFEPGMHAKALERLELQADLRLALDRGGEFTLLYQPIVMLQTGDVKGVEALVRWNHPERGVLTPMQFIPLAEETGLIVPLGRWVLREACRQAALWQARRGTGHPLTLTVNVSGHQLQYEAVVDDVRRALSDSGLDPRQLVLEITESVLMQQNEVILERLRALKAVGIRLAIDDFGTGYSSLGYLQRFPVDILKIDKAFVDDIGSAGTEPALVRAILALGETLQLQTIAEGIEQSRQLSGLQELGCEMGQGFYFARPVEVVEIDALLDAQRAGVPPERAKTSQP
jgi:diguanylate cyclase (GGDEF)-like protein/PAS domain S-box-containing protein